MDWIDENIAVGNWNDARHLDVLKEEGIDLIIDARTLFDDSEGRSKRRPILEKVERSSDLLVKLSAMNVKVMIRCHHGRDRAPFLAMLYVSKKNGMSHSDAYNFVAKKREITVFHWDWVKMLNP